MNITNVGRILVAAIMVAGFAGCKMKEPSLEGEITVDGQKPVDGLVVIKGEDGTTVAGPILPNGSYCVQNVPRGPVKIAVAPNSMTTLPQANNRNRAKQQYQKLPDYMPTATNNDVAVMIPTRYQQPETSGLSTTVRGGSNRQNLELASR